MLFFDLEFYVPPDQRRQRLSSMIANPASPTHLLLGGSFVSKKLTEPVPDSPTIQGLWIWREKNDEAALLRKISALFESEWKRNAAEKVWILGKPIEDLVVVGAGISRFDLPALYCRAVHHRIAAPEDLFDLFLKPKTIDLANTGCFLFDEDAVLYPKTMDEISRRLKIDVEKGSSKKVWQAFAEKDFSAIEKRTEAEVRAVLRAYKGMSDLIARDVTRPR